MIPFNLPYLTGRELHNIALAHGYGQLAGDGRFTKQCHRWLEVHTKTSKVLLTHSCTAALEMTALLLDLQPGDEIIMPSYTFVSTANAFVLRGAVPVFVDVRADTFNLDEKLIEDAITPRTKAIVPVHYAGVACDMDSIMEIATRHGLKVVEDAAQGIMASYKGKSLGAIGHFGTYSFHETKNIISGEGGALLVNDKAYIQQAEIIREKGTDRSQFFRGEVDKYSWQSVGSSYLPGELIAAFLSAQLESADEITNGRLRIWDKYHELFQPLESEGLLRRPIVPDDCQHNAHMYYIVLPSLEIRTNVVNRLKEQDVHAVFHYVPLHDSPAGKRYGRTHGDFTNTYVAAEQLLRMPLWIGLEESQQQHIVSIIQKELVK
ncbi:MAG: dTDP-4-amino-4,6-dideoxygalactose transaminase [Gammaproteobacteria bacterium]|nr:dTDP-4-amino-4,6-dideoxygalactose transaminase [Gammaproteobacteria bacterium]